MHLLQALVRLGVLSNLRVFRVSDTCVFRVNNVVIIVEFGHRYKAIKVTKQL